MDIIHQPWRQQPTGAAAVDNPAWALDGLWVPTFDGNLARRARGGPVVLSNTGKAGHAAGLAWTNAAGTNSYVTLLTKTPVQGCTIVLGGGVVTSGTNGEFGINSTNNIHRLGGHIPYSADGKVYFDFGGIIEGSTRLSIASLTIGRNDVWAFTCGPRGMEIWQNGVRRASNGANPSRTSVDGTPWGLAPHNSTWASTSRAASQWFLAAFSSQQAAPAQLAKLTSPAAAFGELFEARRIFVPVASTAPPSSFIASWARRPARTIGAGVI